MVRKICELEAEGGTLRVETVENIFQLTVSGKATDGKSRKIMLKVTRDDFLDLMEALGVSKYNPSLSTLYQPGIKNHV